MDLADLEIHLVEQVGHLENQKILIVINQSDLNTNRYAQISP